MLGRSPGSCGSGRKFKHFCITQGFTWELDAVGTGGLLVTEANMHLIPGKGLEEWQDAVEEYRRGNGAGAG